MRRVAEGGDGKVEQPQREEHALSWIHICRRQGSKPRSTEGEDPHPSSSSPMETWSGAPHGFHAGDALERGSAAAPQPPHCRRRRRMLREGDPSATRMLAGARRTWERGAEISESVLCIRFHFSFRKEMGGNVFSCFQLVGRKSGIITGKEWFVQSVEN